MSICGTKWCADKERDFLRQIEQLKKLANARYDEITKLEACCKAKSQEIQELKAKVDWANRVASLPDKFFDDIGE